MSVDAEEIKTELDLEFFIQKESLSYKMGRGSSGMQVNVRNCPACGDGRWRVYLNAESGQGNCFVCNAKFNKLTFVHAYLAGSWPETFRYCEEALREQGWRPKRTISAAVQVPDEIVLPTSMELPTPDGQNLAYLENRGFSGDIAAYFHLRYCQFGWWKYNDPDTGALKNQSFANRVIIPVYDLDGKLVTFQGRDITNTSERKYLFPVTLPGTGRYLLNGQNVLATNEVAMGEGFGDVAALKQAFDGDTALRHIVPVGSFGKHLSYGSLDGNDQLGRFLDLRRRGITTCTIMWDGEEKALIAALDAGKILTGVGLKTRIARLPAGKDPNEVLPEVVRAAYYAASLWTPSLDVKWRLRNPYRV